MYFSGEPREQVPQSALPLSCRQSSRRTLSRPPQTATTTCFAVLPSARQVIGLVWLGSQATKPVRLALAALTAPAVDRLIASTQRRLGLKKKDAVSLLVAAIFGSTAAFCLAVLAYGVARAAMVSTVASAGPPSSSAAFLIQRRMMERQQ